MHIAYVILNTYYIKCIMWNKYLILMHIEYIMIKIFLWAHYDLILTLRSILFLNEWVCCDIILTHISILFLHSKVSRCYTLLLVSILFLY